MPIIEAATTLTGVLIDKGVNKLLEANEGKIILWRAVNKASKKYKGYAPGGRGAIKDYLWNWTNSKQFTELIQALEKGHKVDEVVSKALKSFKKQSVSELNNKAETVLEYLFLEISNGLLKSSYGPVLMWNKFQMKLDSQTKELQKGQDEIKDKIDQRADTLEDLLRTKGALSVSQQEAVNEYLTISQEWSSIKDLIDSGKFKSANEQIEKRLGKLSEIYLNQPDSREVFKRHHVELLLKLASSYSNLGAFQKSEKYYSEAKKMGIETPYLKRIESKLLINLNKISEFELLLEENELDEREIAEAELLLLKDKWEELLKELPETNDNFRVIYLRLLGKIFGLEDQEFEENALEIRNEIRRAFKHTGKQPIHKIQVADVSIKFLRRICFGMFSIEEINKTELVNEIREYIDTAIRNCKEVDYQRGLIIILNSALKFYSMLEEEEAMRVTEIEIQNYSETEEINYEFDLKRNNVSKAIELHNEAINLSNNSEDEEPVEHLLQTAFQLSNKDEKIITGQSLINFYLGRNEIDKAEKILSRFSGIPEHAFSLIELSIIERKESEEKVLEHLTILLEQFPLSIQFRRYYVETLIQRINKNRNEGITSTNNDLIKEVENNVEVLNNLLPTDSNHIFHARALIADQDYNSAIKALKGISTETKVNISALRLRAYCLIELNRFNEVPSLFEELAKLTNDPRYAHEGAKFYLSNGQIDEAYELLSGWVEKYPDDPALIAIYGVSIISKDEVTPEEGYRALTLLKRANQLHPGFPNIYKAIAKAANIAGVKSDYIEYSSKGWSGVPSISINQKEDFNQLDQKMEDGLVRIDLQGQEGIQAFIEWNKEFTSSLNTFHRYDLMTYIDTFSRNGQAWSQWIGWTTVASENFYKNSFVLSVRCPWPFTKKIEEQKKGILLDLTALLSLCVLSETDRIIRKLSSQGFELYLRVNELKSLRRVVNKPEEVLFDVVKYPYDELYNLLKENELITDYSVEQWDKFSELVPDDIELNFGNHAVDYGLSLSLESSSFILDKIDGMEGENRRVLEKLTSSKVLLKSLVHRGLVGENEANLASKRNERFKGWRDVNPIVLPDEIVFSAFSIQHWYEAGLLNSWINSDDHWPKINFGPFGVTHLKREALRTKNEKKVQTLSSKQLSEIEALIEEGILNTIPDVQSEIEDSFFFRSSNVHAIKILELAKFKDLDLWTDDRVFGYLLWPFNHPIPINEIRDEFSQLQKKYSTVNILTTEDLLGEIYIKEDDSEFAEKMGHQLVELGYRPLHFKLAVRYLLNNYSYDPDLPKYGAFIKTLEGFLIDENYDHEPKADPKPQQRLFLGRIVPGIIATILLCESKRSFEERKSFANDILSLLIKYIDEHLGDMRDKIGSFWVSLLHEIVDFQSFNKIDLAKGDEFQNRLNQSLLWFTQSLIQYEDSENIKKTVLVIEDFLIKHVTQMREILHQKDIIDRFGLTEGELREKSKLIITSRIQALIQPLICNQLLESFNPLLRRSLGHISSYPHEFKISHTYFFDFEENTIEDEIPEDDLEQNALQILGEILQGNTKLGEYLTSDLRINYRWKRLKPEQIREHPEDFYWTTVDISMIRLILRDELHEMPEVIEGIIRQLQLIDPLLGAKIQQHEENLLSDDERIRKVAREEIAFSVIKSVLFEFQRDVQHFILRLQEMETSDLDGFIAPKSGWFLKEMHPSVVEVEGKEYPRNVLIDAELLVASAETLYHQCFTSVDISKKDIAEDGSEIQLGSIYVSSLREEISPFIMAHRLLELLIYSEADSNKIEFEGNKIEVNEFIKTFLTQVLDSKINGSDFKIIYRDQDLRVIHSCLLRLSLFVSGAPKHISNWNTELDDNEQVMGRLLNNVLIFSQRLIPVLKGKYGDNIKGLKNDLMEVVNSLDIAYKEPKTFPDRFNPLLFGPHLLDHEATSVMYSLAVFISKNENPESIIDLDWLKKLVEPWTESINPDAEKIYQKQKEESSDIISIKMPLSPKEAAEELIKVIKQRMEKDGIK
ncbi:MAG: hypothetical protein CL666_11720 [Balneola sp.]|nr:hypothetical protein [Balneola sp.]|tara:strand:- start:23208 stop:29213 length:6006 start_codon:yes stop_codon:yes gene_type:complete